jgi:hypothetical protein
MLELLPEHYSGIFFILVGLLVILRPPPKGAQQEEQRQARLAELRAGAEERYFEERREFEAYGLNSAGPFRLWEP